MASEGGGEFLIQAATYLGAAAVAVPVFNRFKLGSILGYLAAGVVVGPYGLNLLQHEEGVFHVAEFGVVLFLFVIGLELSLARLWAMRRDIFGLGAAQMAATGLIIGAALVATGAMPTAPAAIAGLALAFSSTAFAMQMLKESGELNSPFGTRAFSVLLFQDLAVIPLLIAIPFAAGALPDIEGAGLVNALKGAGVIAALIVIGRYLLNPVLRLVAGSGSREAFAATALFIVAATSLAMTWAGLSMALGAFLAGVLLAESAYRHQIETDIEPFRGLLLGLFFISIGMRLDLSAIAASWMIVVFGSIFLVATKAAVLFLLTRASGSAAPDSAKVGVSLSQSGEFAFVVFSLGASAALFTAAQASLMSAVVTISMAMTPPLMMLARSLLDRKTDEGGGDLETATAHEGHVIVAGFGRMGQIVSQVLSASGVQVTAIDRNAAHIRNAERFGFKVYYGDGSRLDTLVTAGALEATAVILTMDDPPSVNHAVASLRERAPNLTIIAIAHDRMHEIALRPLGPDVIVRETLESSLLVAREALRRMNHPEAQIDDFIRQFRKLDRERLLQQMDYGPEAGKDLLHRRFESAGRDA